MWKGSGRTRARSGSVQVAPERPHHLAVGDRLRELVEQPRQTRLEVGDQGHDKLAGEHGAKLEGALLAGAGAQ